MCTGETYKNVVKMTFAKGAVLKDPSGLFNSSLDGNVRRVIDIHEGDKVDESALKDLIRAAVALNLMVKNKPKPRRARGKRAVTSFIAGAGRISSHKGRASAPASYVKHFGVDAPELAAEARSGNAGKAANHCCGTKTCLEVPLCLCADSDLRLSDLDRPVIALAHHLPILSRD